MFTRRHMLRFTAAALFTLSAMVGAQAADKVTIFAAASLKTALDHIAADYKARNATDISISYAGSSALAKQIEEGAPADIFMSADLDWMTYLADKNLIQKDSQVQLLGNELVLVAPKDVKIELKIAKGFDLVGALHGGKLAMGEVKSVPAGKYGKAALDNLGVWAAVEPLVAQAENVRAALKLVDIGEATLGIVYKTDAHADQAVRVLDTFPEDTHPPIIYPVALTATSKTPQAQAFLKELESDDAKGVFEAQGFTVLRK